MSKYKIKVSVDLVECDDEIDPSPISMEDGSYEFTICENDAESIDNCEIALLKTAFPTIREAISRHMKEISKKKP